MIYAKRRGTNLNAVVSDALRRYLEREERPVWNAVATRVIVFRSLAIAEVFAFLPMLLCKNIIYFQYFRCNFCKNLPMFVADLCRSAQADARVWSILDPCKLASPRSFTPRPCAAWPASWKHVSEINRANPTFDVRYAWLCWIDNIENWLRRWTPKPVLSCWCLVRLVVLRHPRGARALANPDPRSRE